MSITRPLSKSLLKKMFLKVLYEHRQGGYFQGNGWDYIGILHSSISSYFKFDKLTENEYADALRGVYELERDGYIMQDPTQTSERFKKVTKRGLEIVTKELESMVLTSIDIDQLLTNSELVNKVHDDFIERDYETAVFKAFRMIEEKTREKGGFENDVIGAELMSRAFSPNNGLLKNRSAQTEGEDEAFHLLMRSAIMWFKNPASHRTVGYNDEHEAAQVLGYADLLLKMIDNCENR